MYISTIILTSYSPTATLEGYIEVKAGGQTLKVKFDPSDIQAIQSICADTYLRERQTIVADILGSPLALAAPIDGDA